MSTPSLAAADRYFQEAIKPHVDNQQVIYVGEVDHAGKVELLSGAMAMFFFPAYGESCPLVVLESLACGTPVLGIASGPVPELVTDGLTGFLVPDAPAMAQAIAKIGQLDRKAIRRIAVERFDISRMVDDYLRLYETVISGKVAANC